jgi:hypothetical protein
MLMRSKGYRAEVPKRRSSGIRAIGSAFASDANEGTTVRFAERPDGSIEAVEIVTQSRSGVFSPVCQALFEHGVQIVASRVVMQANSVSARFELATEDGGPIPRDRGLVLQSAVLSTLVFAAPGAG